MEYFSVFYIYVLQVKDLDTSLNTLNTASLHNNKMNVIDLDVHLCVKPSGLKNTTWKHAELIIHKGNIP